MGKKREWSAWTWCRGFQGTLGSRREPIISKPRQHPPERWQHGSETEGPSSSEASPTILGISKVHFEELSKARKALLREEPNLTSGEGHARGEMKRGE